MLPRVDRGLARAGRGADGAARRFARGGRQAEGGARSRSPTDPGLAYERFIWRMRKDRYEDAAALIVEAATAPKRWAGPRNGPTGARCWRGGCCATAIRAWPTALRPRTSWRAARTMPIWNSWRVSSRCAVLATRGAALEHFRALGAAVATPISLARAAYWEGRALEALNRPQEAQAAYARAAEFQTAYYGLLASERAGIPLTHVVLGQAGACRTGRARPLPDRRSSRRRCCCCGRGTARLAKRFLLHLAEGLDAAGTGAAGRDGAGAWTSRISPC